ncbi:MAG: amidinotransferase, partial [Planctomycetales bacterium]|nr:amidinotransferase [Planctomycetales bacterium]
MAAHVDPPRILMCPPLFYGIEYEINPWMNTKRQVNHALAVEQWNGLRAAFAQAGATIETMMPIQGLPDLVFTANAAVVYRDRAIVAQFKHPQRQGETFFDWAWLASDGFNVVAPP